jgi:hypothetical protein
MTLHHLRIGARWLLRTAHLGITVAVLTVGAPALTQELSPELREKLLKEQAIDAMKSGDTASLFDAMDEYRALAVAGVTIPPGLLFAEADAARSSGDPVRAERAFNDYFEVANPEGEAFAEALRTYAEFRKTIPDATWSILESMTPIPGGVVRTVGAQREVRVAPFSLAQRAVTHGEFAAFLEASGYRAQQSDQGNDADCQAEASEMTIEPTSSEPAVCVSWSEASAYVAWLSETSGLRFRLPSAVEWERAASTPAGLGDRAGNRSEWVGDCAVPSGAAPDRADSCNRRIAMRLDTPGDSPRPPGDARLIRGDDYRASDLGFRIALGP